MEGSLAPMLQMVALKDLKDNRVETTLLSLESPLIRRNALVVSIIKGGEPAPLKQSGILPMANEKSLWIDFPYQSFGSQMDVSQKPIQVATPVANNALVEQWVQQDGRSQYLDPFQPDPKSQESVVQELSEGTTYRAPLEPTPTIKPTTKRSRAAKGASKAAIISALETATPAATKVVTPAANPTVVPVLVQKVTLIGTRVEAQSRFGTIREDSASRSPIAKENRLPFDEVTATLIESPHNAPSESASPANLIVPSRSVIQGKPAQSVEWESKPVRGAKAGILIDVQENPENATSKKDLRRTMGQKRPKKNLSGSNTGMIRDFEVAARQVLDVALLYQGPTKIEVGIGRLLVNPQGGSADSRRPFTVAEWSPSSAPTKNGVNDFARETIFTPRLTTHSPDANAILNIKLSRGQSLFVGDPCERKVTYIILCITRAKERIIIEVSEDGSFKIKGSELLVGALDWHFPLRSWDSRLQVTTQEPLMSNYQQQVQGVVRNMKVTVDRQGVKFSSTTIDQEVRLN